ncbi:hypothetical protein [Nocardiopsis lucentensis]|uniref:hypothetical protein n=1 Tax=Nocardiopsis lucentensis TaxID=53441 RepID=UPI0003490D4D|nr:hypothetical protein [Nocardiopsis lucentensis]
MKDDWQHEQPPGSEGYDYDAGTGGYSPPPGYGSAPGHGEPSGYGHPPPPPAFSPAPGYGPPPPGYGTPPTYGAPPAHGAPHGGQPGTVSMVLSLVVAIGMVSTCCNVFAIPGIVFSAIALSDQRDHERATRFTRYAWISNGVNVALVVLFVVVMLLTET